MTILKCKCGEITLSELIKINVDKYISIMKQQGQGFEKPICPDCNENIKTYTLEKI